MKSLLDKLTFRLLIGQLLPGAFLALTAWVAVESGPRPTAFQWPNFGPLDLWQAYANRVAGLSDLTSILALSSAAVVLGLALQTTTTLAAANRESFRTTELDETHRWVQKDPSNIRKRSVVRQWIAELWSYKPLWILLPLAPLILLFDFFSILAAKPRDLYKEIYIVRASADKMEPIASVISDSEYSAEYFGNMALAMYAHFGIAIAFLDLSKVTSLAYLALVYGLVSIHYVSFRAVRTSIDQSVGVAFLRAE